jgi:hypothetical protein
MRAAPRGPPAISLAIRSCAVMRQPPAAQARHKEGQDVAGRDLAAFEAGDEGDEGALAQGRLQLGQGAEGELGHAGDAVDDDLHLAGMGVGHHGAAWKVRAPAEARETSKVASPSWVPA